MKIHIVQKGDTLWNLAQKYGVDFEELLQANSHLANPDLIMPGMKVKIPTIAVPAKKEAVKGKVVAPKQAVKKEVQEVKKQLPKMEWESPQIVAETEHSQLIEMVKKAAPHVLKKLLVEHKPEVVQQIKIEIINQQETQVQMAHKAPMPKVEPYVPPKPMPMPQMVAPQAVQPCPPAKPMPMPQMVAPQAVQPCPPAKPMHAAPMHHCPKCASKKHQGMPQLNPMMPQTQGWEMGPAGQGMGAIPPYGSGYGMMPSMPGGYAPLGGYPGMQGSMLPGTPMGGYGEGYLQPGTGVGPLGNYGAFGQHLPAGSYMRDEEPSQEEQQD